MGLYVFTRNVVLLYKNGAPKSLQAEHIIENTKYGASLIGGIILFSPLIAASIVCDFFNWLDKYVILPFGKHLSIMTGSHDFTDRLDEKRFAVNRKCRAWFKENVQNKR